ncbi:MAG TPA: hypothetical protein VMA77_02970 [Solirubrobacteraceae bacterium]|nr:hypothetical protein [Solirubrobacteraceae bacterium]
MRLHRCVPVLAVVVSLAGVSAPLAEASQAEAPSAGIPQPTTPTVIQHHSAGSADWIIGIGTAAGIAVLGTGAVATRRNRRLTLAGSGDTRPAS